MLSNCAQHDLNIIRPDSLPPQRTESCISLLYPLQKARLAHISSPLPVLLLRLDWVYNFIEKLLILQISSLNYDKILWLITWLIKNIVILSGRVTVMQIFALNGINYSSPALASTLNNMVPAYAFILAVIFRSLSPMEVTYNILSFTNNNNNKHILHTCKFFNGLLFGDDSLGPNCWTFFFFFDQNWMC